MSEQIPIAPPPPLTTPRAAPVVRAEAVEPAAKPEPAKREPSGGEQSTDFAGQERRLTISRNELLKTFVYRSVDEETGKIVWQWPSEEILRRAERQYAAEQRKVDERA